MEISNLRILAWLLLAAHLPSCNTLPSASPPPPGHVRPLGVDFEWPSGLQAGQTLSAEQCVEVALWNNPDFQAALAELGLSRAEMAKAGQLANPSLALLFPSDAKALEMAAKLPLDALWLRPKRMKIAGIEADAVAAKLMQGGADLARDVRIAHAAVISARDRATFAAASAQIFEEMTKMAGAREQAGETGGLEAAQARSESAVAKQEAERLKHEERVALEKLRGLCGMARLAGTLEVSGNKSESTASEESLEASIAKAIASRPDVRAAELTVLAAGQRAGLAKAEIATLTASAKYTDGAGTQPGFDLALPIFHQNQAARLLADAQVEQAMRKLAAARHKAAAEVRHAHAMVQQARAVSAGWEKVLPELHNVLTTAQKAVAAGAAPHFAALDAARREADGHGKATESTARLREAKAELRRAMGLK